VETIVAKSDSLVLCAEAAEGIVACCQLTAQGGGTVHLGMLSVRPDLQARGMGRRLLAEAEAWARTRFGGRRVRMTVISRRSELLDWYARRGYLPTGEVLPFRAEPTDRLLAGDLDFVVLVKELSPSPAPDEAPPA